MPLFERLRRFRSHGLMNRDEVAFFGNNSRLDSLQAVIGNRIIGQTDFITDHNLIHHEGGSIFGNVRPEVIADRIAYEIDRYDAKGIGPTGRPYDRILLVGHSAGAQLLRKAVVFALGSLEDSEAKLAYRWPCRVDRIVSLAGLDGGIPFAQRPANMSAPVFLAREIAYNVARVFHTAKFIRALGRGEPFVANLRVQWIRLLHRPPGDEQWLESRRASWLTAMDVRPSSAAREETPAFPELPLVYQLVGDRDELVTRSDTVDDLLRSRTYIYRTVINANHASITRPSKNEYVYREIVHALSSTAPERVAVKESDMTDVFYVIHGIRDLGSTWTPGICEAIRTVAATDTSAARKIRTVRSSYGYFSMLSFLLSPDRQKNVRWFMDIYTLMIARYPNAIHNFVGHSNGTHILSSALERYATCKMRNVVFAGSVAPCAFDCTKFQQAKQVSNDAGSADWVVGIFPHLFELIAGILYRFDLGVPKWMDLGAAGFYGFYDDAVTNNLWLAGTHGAALTHSNFQSIAESVTFGRDCPPKPPTVKQSEGVLYLSKLAWLVLPIIAALFWGDITLWRIGLWWGAAATSFLLLVFYTV
jgi:Lipase (class 2)